MNTVRKIASLFLATIVLSALLVGCATKGTCDDCGQYEKLNKFTDSDGDVRWVCDDDLYFEKLFG
jgi:hypothetical protein